MTQFPRVSEDKIPRHMNVMYQMLKDFAGPVATIIAAFTVAYFVKRQADTALDQLRYNLFKKRYAIYVTAKELITFIVCGIGRPGFDRRKIRQFYVTLDEARFFFSKDICVWLRTVEDDCRRLLEG